MFSTRPSAPCTVGNKNSNERRSENADAQENIKLNDDIIFPQISRVSDRRSLQFCYRPMVFHAPLMLIIFSFS